MHRILAEINVFAAVFTLTTTNLTLIGYYPHYVNSSPLNWKQYRFVSEETKQWRNETKTHPLLRNNYRSLNHHFDLIPFSPVSPTRFGFVHKSSHCCVFIYVGGGAGTRVVVHIYKMASVVSCRVQCKDCEGRFSFFSLHLRSKCTFEGLTNEQEMCSRILEWKGMCFTMSPRYIRRTISHCKVAELQICSIWKLYGLGKKVSCPPGRMI